VTCCWTARRDGERIFVLPGRTNQTATMHKLNTQVDDAAVANDSKALAGTLGQLDLKTGAVNAFGKGLSSPPCPTADNRIFPSPSGVP
jgi:hypothetical protein